MEAIELLKTRRSCRKFKEDQVKKEDVQSIIECGVNAPSASNKQDTKIVVVQDSITVKDLSRLNSEVMGISYDQFYDAPMVCLILAPKDNPNGMKDGSLVIGAMQNAAFAIGVGSCWINRCKEMFELKEGKAYLEKWGVEEYTGIGCCILGYPAQEFTAKVIKEGRVLWV